MGPAGQDIGGTTVVRYESSPAKLNRLGRMQVRDKAKAGLGAAAGGGARGRTGGKREERGEGANQPRADKKQEEELGRIF